MSQKLSRSQRNLGALAVLALLGATLACYKESRPTVPPAPIVFRWPDPAFNPAHQCRGGFTGDDLTRYMPRARLALWLPSTAAVELDEERGCIAVTVETIGTGRLVELLLRGVAVPRRAILLELAG